MQTSKFFESPEAFRSLFDFEAEPKYERYTPLKDRKAAFSVQKIYPSDILYSPPTRKNGEPDVVSIIHVIYNHPSEQKNFKSNKIPIILTVTPFSRFLANHFDYDFTNEECPTAESVERSKATPKPIGLDFMEDFFYDHDNNTIINSTGKTLNGRQVLDYVFQKHCDTVHRFKGLKLRFHLRSKNINIWVLSFFIDACESLLKIAFGRTLEPEGIVVSAFEGYSKKDLKILNTDSINVFGYKASKNVIVSFCLLVFIGYLFGFLFCVSSEFFKGMFSNGFLIATNAILLLFLMDVIFPKFVFWLLNKFIKIRTSLMFKKFKF